MAHITYGALIDLIRFRSHRNHIIGHAHTHGEYYAGHKHGSHYMGNIRLCARMEHITYGALIGLIRSLSHRHNIIGFAQRWDTLGFTH